MEHINKLVESITMEDFEHAGTEHKFSEQFEKNMQRIILESAVEHSGKRTPFHLKREAVAAALLSVILILSGGVTYASKVAHVNLSPLNWLYGSSDDDSQEIIDNMTSALHESATSGGIKMTADAIVRDGDNHFIIVYNLIRTDGTSILPKNRSLETRNEAGDLVNQLYFDDEEVTFTDLNPENFGFGYSGIFYDENPDDPSIQYMEDCDFHLYDSAELSEKTEILTVHKKLVLRTEEKHYQFENTTLSGGTWKFKLKIPEKTDSLKLAQNEKFHCDEYEGYDCIIDSLDISPLGITLNYKIIADTFTRKQGIDHYVPVDITLNLKNGESIEMKGYQTSGVNVGYDETETYIPVEETQYYGKAIELSEIERVTVGDLTVKVDSGEKK